MKLSEGLAVSLNVSILSVFYTILGACISYVFYYLFDEHNEDWEKKSMTFKLVDVFAEIALIGLIAFWTTYFIKGAAPIFSVSKALDELVDVYISGIFFVFAMFLFLEDLNSKVKYVYHTLISNPFKKYLPDSGSILDGSIKFVKTE